MIVKGIVESIESDYLVKVRIPLLDGLADTVNGVGTRDLNSATICSLPNCSNNVSQGDVVFVGFENNDIGKPIILGHLFKEVSDSTLINIKVNSLTANYADLPENTSIGNVTGSNLKCLQNMDENIKDTFRDILARLENLEGKGE